MTMEEAAPIGDIFCTLTGNIDVIRAEHFRAMQDGAIVCNSGHFNVELDLAALAEIADGPARSVREFVEEYLIDGQRVFVLGEGRLINLAAAEGHPASVMDMSFANQSLAAEYLVGHAATLLDAASIAFPRHWIPEIARLKLAAMGVGRRHTRLPNSSDTWRRGTWGPERAGAVREGARRHWHGRDLRRAVGSGQLRRTATS